MNRDMVVTSAENWGGLSQVDPLGRHGDLQSGINFSRLLGLLKEWRWLILSACLAGILLGTAASLLTTPMYRGSVVLQVNPPTYQVIDEKTRGVSSDASQFVATQEGLLQSRGVSQRVALELGLAAKPPFADEEAPMSERVQQAASAISNNLEVATRIQGELIRFSIIWESPTRAAEIANAYAEAFIETSLERRYEASAFARKFLQRQISRTRRDLQNSERQLVQYAQSHGIIDTSTGQNTRETDASSPQGQSLIALNDSLAQAITRRVVAEGVYRQTLNAGVTTESATSTQALRQQLAQLQADYQAKRAFLKPDHPDMVSLRTQIGALDKAISTETSRSQSGIANSARADYEAASSAERSLQGKVAGLKAQVLNARGRNIQYAIIQRDVDTNRALYDALLQRYKEIGVAGGVGESPVSIVDRATVPRAAFKPNLILNLLIGSFLGLLVGIGAAFGLDILNDTMRTPSDVRNKLGLAFLTAIPNWAGAAKKMALLDELDDPGSPAAESYATLATSLRFVTEEGLPRALMVTSTRESEGKSSTALALCHYFAKTGKKVLLIDADLRKPTFRGNKNQKGLTALLTTEEPLSSSVASTKYEGLWLLNCGLEPPNPATLLASPRFRELLEEACAEYELVVIDSPPLLGLADAALIASVVNVVLLVVESGRTRTSAIREAVQRLREVGANIVGVALTKHSPQHSEYGYGYGYGYGAGRYGYGKNRYGVAEKPRGTISLIEHQQ